MKITWIGHSCFKIDSGKSSIVIDPYADDSVPGLGNVREEANKVLSTHGHFDHNFTDGVKIIDAPLDIFVEEIDSFHDEAKGAKRGKNKIYILSDGKSRIAHLGDLGEELFDERLYGLDALLIPVGGYYTIDGNEAAKIVKELKPRMAIPMHYRSDERGFGFAEIGQLSVFLSHFSDDYNLLLESVVDTDTDYTATVVAMDPQNRKR